ncbi:MAG TPA: prephenate dehydrogenase/arogenate dehydrogenase family protein [Vicinamibacterales bacterium]|nr:prephenate dehydrogenase/arogenate dehydrogenase family protein [Vicinamibacterales bacterium]
MLSAPFPRIAIVGVGLLGGSIAKAALRQWPAIEIIPIEANESVAQAARADLVVLAAPILANIARLSELSQHVGRDAVITDVSSTKRRIVSAANAIPALNFIGGHPMAGNARGGAANARADLFDGHPWILTPAAGQTAALQRLEEFVSGLRGVPHIMTPELHDRFVGAVSHLPQLSASALMHVVGELAGDAGLELAGRGLHDSTRLAASPPDIWKDVAATNDDVLRDALDVLIATLIEMRDSLETGDAIETVFTSARRWRDALDRH